MVVVAVRQPRLDRRIRETRARLVGPVHRRAFVVAAVARAVELADGIEHAVDGYVGVDHADLVAVVDERRAAQRHEHHHPQACLARVVGAPAGREAVLVVVPTAPHRPRGVGEQAFCVLDDFAQLGRVELRVQHHEVERQVQLVAVAVERREVFRIEHIGLTDQHTRRVVALGQLAPPTDHIVHFGTARGVERLEPHHLRVRVVVLRGGRVVAQLFVFDDRVAHVDSETRNAPVEPEAQDAIELVADLFVPPVEVGLRREKLVEVVLAARLVERPCRDTRVERHAPVVRYRAVGLGVGPHVPVAVASRSSTTWRRGTTGAGRSCGSERGRGSRGCCDGPPRR